MKPTMYVFRISKGNKSGNPIGACPLDYSKVKAKINKLTSSQINPIEYERDKQLHLNFIYDEFWNNKVLRQGWGIANLDLNIGKLDTKKWIENYMFSGKTHWNANIECKEAKGRWNIMRRIHDMNVGDIIFLPKTSRKHLSDHNIFTVCQVKEKYYFDYPNNIRDFGHCIKVKNIQEFSYSDKNLLQGDFGSPYLWAVTEVKKHHERHDIFKDFIKRELNISV